MEHAKIIVSINFAYPFKKLSCDASYYQMEYLTIMFGGGHYSHFGRDKQSQYSVTCHLHIF